MALIAQTFCQLYLLEPHNATATATEAIMLCDKELTTTIGQGPQALTHTLLYALYLDMSGSFWDTGDVEKALEYLQMAKNELEQEEILSSQIVGSDIHCYLVIATRKSRSLFAQGRSHYTEAAGLIKAVIDKQRTRAKARPYFYSVLSVALRYAGVFYRALGRYAEGAEAASEVVAIKRGLAEKSVASLVEVEESLEVSHGLRKSVFHAQAELTCNHQT